MALISFLEVVDIVIMSLFLGFLFQDIIFPRGRSVDPTKMYATGFDWKGFWYSTMLIAPSIILHELGHKFVAMSYGMQAVFHAFYAQTFTFWLGMFALLSKFFSFGFIFLVPGFVSITGTGTALEFALISFAGPAVHLVVWIGSLLVLTHYKKLTSKQKIFVTLLKQINMFLFIFNMLPIPGFDGFGVYSSLLRAFTG